MAQSLLAALLLLSSLSAHAAGEVFLFGGGARQPAALQEFVAAAGVSPKILIVGWASETPEDTMSSLRGELEALGVTVNVSPTPPQTAQEAERFLADAGQASGIFFSGGDQTRILDVFQKLPTTSARVLERWREGVPLAGTSAGTAILSLWAFTGNEDLTHIDPQALNLIPGLGVLGDTIVDQHFIVRQRENRLFGAILRHPDALGIGIDEDNVLVVRDPGGQAMGKVLGPTGVMFVQAVAGGAAPQLLVTLVPQGQCWDFANRRATACY